MIRVAPRLSLELRDGRAEVRGGGLEVGDAVEGCVALAADGGDGGVRVDVVNAGRGEALDLSLMRQESRALRRGQRDVQDGTDEPGEEWELGGGR